MTITMYKPVEAEAKALRRYRPDRVLNAISKASAWRRRDTDGFAKALAKENLNYRVALRDYQLAFVAKLVLYWHAKPRLSSRQFDWKDLLQFCRAVAKHQEPANYPINSPEDAEKFMIRLSYQQFPDFYGDSDVLGRTRLLFRTCAKNVGTVASFDLDKAYIEATGLTLDQTWDITLGLYGLILTKNGGIQSRPITAGDLKQCISDSDIARFVNLVSLTPQEFETKLRLSEYRLDPYETFNPNPLVHWPLIKLDGNRWVVPIVSYLLRRGTEQIFYDVIGHSEREFAGFFGHVFEDYADHILSTLGSGYEVISEKQYRRDGKAYDTCDRIIIKNGNAVLIECKTKRLSLRSKFTADRELLRRDITDRGKADDKGNIVHAIRQLYRTERDIRANSAGLEELHQKITGKMYPLVLVLDPYYFANAPYLKGIITDELRKGIPPSEDFSWQILDARGFESLCALAQQDDLIDLIAKKFLSPELAIEDMKTFVDRYLESKRQMGEETPMHPALVTEVDALSVEIESRYGIRFKRRITR